MIIRVFALNCHRQANFLSFLINLCWICTCVYFKTRNGSSNYALIAKDGIHLNASGTAVLAKNLDINIQLFKKDNSKKKQAVNNNATQVNRLPSCQPNQGKVRKPEKTD